jgi:hypothetical protein
MQDMVAEVLSLLKDVEEQPVVDYGETRVFLQWPVSTLLCVIFEGRERIEIIIDRIEIRGGRTTHVHYTPTTATECAKNLKHELKICGLYYFFVFTTPFTAASTTSGCSISSGRARS